MAELIKVADDECVFLARQPILNADRELAAYELLFRGAGGGFNQADFESELQATSRVLSNAIQSVGLGKLLGGVKGFVNFNEDVFRSRLHEILDKDIFVLEILEHTEMSADLLELLRNLKKEGYTLALDDFVFNRKMIEKFKPVFPLISVVKIDMVDNDIKGLAEKIKIFKNLNVQVLAEKVETAEEFKLCKEAGFDLFQGFFFAKPEIVSGKKLDPSAVGLIEMIRMVHSDAEIRELVQKVEQYPDIVVNLLRFMNSAFFGIRSEIDSIKQALTLLGRNALGQWLSMLMYSGNNKVPASKNPIFLHAAQRAKIMEFLAQDIPKIKIPPQKAFLTGIVSLMDVVLQVPESEILGELHMSQEINKAILQHEGWLGELLDLASEDSLIINPSHKEKIMLDLGLNTNKVGNAILKSYEWVSKLQ